MKLGKIIGGICLGALAAGLIPYRIETDKEAGTVEVRSLLLGGRKFPGEDKDHFAIAIPSSGLDADFSEADKSEEAEAPKAPEAPEAAEVPAESC